MRSLFIKLLQTLANRKQERIKNIVQSYEVNYEK